MDLMSGLPKKSTLTTGPNRNLLSNTTLDDNQLLSEGTGLVLISNIRCISLVKPGVVH